MGGTPFGGPEISKPLRGLDGGLTGGPPSRPEIPPPRENPPPPGNFPPREISPRGPGGPPGGVPGGVQKGGVWGVLRTPSYGPFGEAYPGPIYIRLYCPGGVWGGILGGSGGPRILSQKRGGEKNQNSVPTGRIIKYPKKVHTRGVPGGPGGPPGSPRGCIRSNTPLRGTPLSGGYPHPGGRIGGTVRIPIGGGGIDVDKVGSPRLKSGPFGVDRCRSMR